MPVYDDMFLGPSGFLPGSVGRTFFVDATGGNDGDDGRSPATAWQTMGKVNGETFLPGDNVLFKRGETWAGTCLTITWSGNAGAPITFGDYGTGNKPIIDGSDVTNCISVTSRSYLLFKNLECTQGFDFGMVFVTSHDVVVVECDCHDCGNDNFNIFTDCYNFYVEGGEFYASYERVVGPQISNFEIADGAHDIVVNDIVARDSVDGAGITIHSHVGTTVPYNITISGAESYGNAQYGIVIFKQDDTADTDRNILVEDSTFRDNTLEGARVTKSVAAANYPDGVTFDDCVFKDNTRYAIWFEGDNILLQRSLIHEGRMCYLRDCVDATIYNCTFYLTTYAGYAPLIVNDNGGRQDNILVRNCIFASPDAGTIIIDIQGITGVDIDYDLYDRPDDLLSRWRWNAVLYDWAGWLLNSAQDANSPAAPQDAMFTNIGADDFTLQAGSPAINVGVDVGLPYCGTAPDCGAYEYCA